MQFDVFFSLMAGFQSIKIIGYSFPLKKQCELCHVSVMNTYSRGGDVVSRCWQIFFPKLRILFGLDLIFVFIALDVLQGRT